LIVVACPLDFCKIEFENINLHETHLRKYKWQSTHTTIVLGKVNPKYFNLKKGEVPDVILTNANDKSEFSSLRILKKNH